MSTPAFASEIQGGRKIAIPRLQRPGYSNVVTKDRVRVARACTACRTQKVKCSGDRPLCKHCETTGRECVYMLPRRDKLKLITERCMQMASLLDELRGRAADEDSARIADLLDAVEDDVSELRQHQAPSLPDTEPAEPGSSRWTQHVTPAEAFKLPPEPLDLLEEDLMRDEQARATGFVGKNSEVQWLQTIVQQLERTDDTPVAASAAERLGSYKFGSVDQVASFTFYQDCEDVDPDFHVEPYELPQPDLAEKLLDCYMATVHDSFPILPRQAFESNIRKYLQSARTGNASRLSPKWQAIFNLVMAIGAKYSHLVRADWRGDERDHLIFQARARAFGLNELALTSHPDVPQIQVLGLLAFYYLSVGQISRAWVMAGMALRFAFALGLHVRNENPSASPTKREMLVRIWWSLYILERVLCNITGRPSIIVDGSCSVPLPIPQAESLLSNDVKGLGNLRKATASTSSIASPSMPGSFFPSPNDLSIAPDHPSSSSVEANAGSFFKATVQMGLITQAIISSLYSAGTMIRSLGDIQQDIVQLGQRIDTWEASLPFEYSFQNRSPPIRPSPPRYAREQLFLGLQYCSARIILTRPCLAGIGQVGRDPNVSESLVLRMAHVCVETAKVAADLLPSQPDSTYLYENGPWWSVVHYLMQAVSVFLLALSHSWSTAQDRVLVVGYVKKLISWLRIMQDPLAERAYEVAYSTLVAVADRRVIDVSDLIAEHTTFLSLQANRTGLMYSFDPRLQGQFIAEPMSVPIAAEPTEGSPSLLRTYIP